jgi:hypothetical protein
MSTDYCFPSLLPQLIAPLPLGRPNTPAQDNNPLSLPLPFGFAPTPADRATLPRRARYAQLRQHTPLTRPTPASLRSKSSSSRHSPSEGGIIRAGAKMFPFEIVFSPKDPRPIDTLLIVDAGDCEFVLQICGSIGGFQGRKWGERRTRT